ncbi:MAG TPA: rhomboid family intramembrane serine protease [Anaerolineales bacterium]|nr:rhomboid family intramembrane serine protease [Anaerolineales bacterium]
MQQPNSDEPSDPTAASLSPQPANTPTYKLHAPEPVHPMVTYVLLGVTLAVYGMQWLSIWILGNDFPAILGMKYTPAILAGEWWRLITPIFLHSTSGLLHIASNMYFLYWVGRSLEQQIGHLRFFGLYLVAGLSGNVLSAILAPETPSLGASTALYGIMIAEVLLIWLNREVFRSWKARLQNAAMVVAINLLITFFVAQIDAWGHIGGLLGGLMVFWLIAPRYTVRYLNQTDIRIEEQPLRLPVLVSIALSLLVWVAMLVVWAVWIYRPLELFLIHKFLTA